MNFNFFDMARNYEQHKVGRFDADWGFVSTAEVTDSDKPYETAIAHFQYNEGRIVVVETYNTRSDAEKGHKRWVATMTAEALPESLTDVSLAGVKQLADMVSSPDDWVFKRDTTLSADVIDN